MFGALTAVAIILLIWQIVCEKIKPVFSNGVYFDSDLYWADVRSGVSAVSQLKKREYGGYWSTKPMPPKPLELPLDTIIDIKRYLHDKALYPHYAEQKRKNGGYRYIQKF